MQPHAIRNPDGSFMNEQQIVEHVAANLGRPRLHRQS
jgi:hypothetical protein